MHASSYYKDDNFDGIDGVDPQRIALNIVVSFEVFLDEKLKTSTDEVLLVLINFVKLVSQYDMFKEAVTIGDSVIVDCTLMKMSTK